MKVKIYYIFKELHPRLQYVYDEHELHPPFFSLHTYLRGFCSSEHVCCVHLSDLKKEIDGHNVGHVMLEEDRRRRESERG